jgi:hypothetical protein
MTQKFRLAVAGTALVMLMLPSLANAASLSSAQASAIVGLLQAFGADQSIVLNVEQALGIDPAATIDPAPPPVTIDMLAHVPVVDSFYRSSNLGFDYSYNAPLFPPTNFGFGLVGVSGGKSFTQNSRINQEYSWARLGGGAAPTFYMNLNAPYGTSVAGHVSSPQTCTVTTVGTTTDPTVCAGYNYGYNAAEYALSYANANQVSSELWWLDIEEANSWSPDTSVNDAVIQGAIDYLNSQGIRVGIYSVPYMWNDIAGSSFVPKQTINGAAVSIPNWIPLGIDTQIGAADYCSVGSPLISGSPVWLVQYESSSTAVDQNFSC